LYNYFVLLLQSEYTCSADKRIAYISGFTGSAGTAVVTQSSAALWADSRYYIQAQEQISKDWKLMKFGETAVSQ
jgi:Xaa-Pro aminopeptidase